MRTTFLLLCAPLISSTSAQLLNGSFEDTFGNADLSHWAGFCGMVSAPSTAPGAGSWCARVDAGNVKGCWPGLYFQTMPTITVGQAFTLAGWCHNLPGVFQPDVGLYFGWRDAYGLMQLGNGQTTTNTTWTYLSLADTFQFGATDTAAVILNAGTLAGPAFAQSEFDGITLEAGTSNGIGEAGTLELPWRYDAGSEQLFIHVGATAPTTIALFDLTGRIVPVSSTLSGTTLVLDLPALQNGVYLARISTRDEGGVLRFVKR